MYKYIFVFIIEAEAVEPSTVRNVYEKAIACTPPIKEKRFWRRYIYLWINYVIYEELTVKDMQQTRQVYQACLDIIPHKLFTFGKIWYTISALHSILFTFIYILFIFISMFLLW